MLFFFFYLKLTFITFIPPNLFHIFKKSILYLSVVLCFCIFQMILGTLLPGCNYKMSQSPYAIMPNGK